MVREKVKHFLGLAEEQGMTVMMAFQPNYTHLDKGEDAPVLQFMPGCQRNHWNYRNADFADLSQMPEKYPVMFQMMDDIMGELKEDSQILAWDLWNEAHPGDREASPVIPSRVPWILFRSWSGHFPLKGRCSVRNAWQEAREIRLKVSCPFLPSTISDSISGDSAPARPNTISHGTGRRVRRNLKTGSTASCIRTEPRTGRKRYCC